MASIKKKIIEGLFANSATRSAVKVMAFFTFLIITRELSLFEYGYLQLFFSLLGPAGMLTLLGLEKVVTADIASFVGQKKYEHSRRLITGYAINTAVCTSVVLVVAYLARTLLQPYVAVDLRQYFILTALLIIGQNGMNLVSVIFTGYERFIAVALVQSGESALRFVFAVLLLLFGHFSIATVIAIYMASKMATWILALPFAIATMRRAQAQLSDTPTASPFRDLLRRHGKWEIGNGVLDTVSANIWPWLLQFFIGTQAVGIYGFAEKVVSFINTALPVEPVLLPIISRSVHEKKEISRIIIMKAKKYLAAAYLVIFVVVALLCGWFVHRFVPGYAAAIPFIIAMSAGLLLDIYGVGQASLLYAYKQQRAIFGLRWILIFVRFFLQAGFMYMLGIWGLLLSNWMVSLFIYAYRERILRRNVDFPLWDWRIFFTFDSYDRMILQLFRAKVGALFSRNS